MQARDYQWILSLSVSAAVTMTCDRQKCVGARDRNETPQTHPEFQAPPQTEKLWHTSYSGLLGSQGGAERRSGLPEHIRPIQSPCCRMDREASQCFMQHKAESVEVNTTVWQRDVWTLMHLKVTDSYRCLPINACNTCVCKRAQWGPRNPWAAVTWQEQRCSGKAALPACLKKQWIKRGTYAMCPANLSRDKMMTARLCVCFKINPQELVLLYCLG